MDEMERQQQEIERLKRKLDSLSEAYQHVVLELNQLKQEKQNHMKKGRPPIDREKRARVLYLYRQGATMRVIADQEKIALSTVHKIITEASGRARIVYVFADREEPATIIDACILTKKVKILNLTDNLVSRAFGIKEKPDWNDYEEFLESRCMPRTRFGIREELCDMGIDSYDPFLILQKTAGRVYGDHQYLQRMRQDWIEAFDEIVEKAGNSPDRRGILLEFLKKTEREWKLNEGEY